MSFQPKPASSSIARPYLQGKMPKPSRNSRPKGPCISRMRTPGVLYFWGNFYHGLGLFYGSSGQDFCSLRPLLPSRPMQHLRQLLVLAVSHSFNGPEDRMNITILHSGSMAPIKKGCQGESSSVRSLCLRGLLAPVIAKGRVTLQMELR